MSLAAGRPRGLACAASACVLLTAGCGTSVDASGAADGGSAPRDAGTSAVPKCGSTPTLLADWFSEVPDAGVASVYVDTLAANATDVYLLFWWSVTINSGMTELTNLSAVYLLRVPVGGGSAVVMASIPGENNQGPEALAVTSNAAVVSEFNPPAASDGGGAGTIVRVPADGSGATILAATSGPVLALVADEENAYFVDSEATKSVPLTGGPVRTVVPAVTWSLGVVGPTLYMTDVAGDVLSVPTGGGKVTVVAKNQTYPYFPMACGPDLCWLNAGDTPTLMQLAPGGAPRVLSNASGTAGAVFDGRNFFLTDQTDHGLEQTFLSRVPATGGPPIVAESGRFLSSVALGPKCLYWSDSQGIFSLALGAADVAGDSGLTP